MRTTTAVRLGAAFTASALALSLGVGSATAEDGSTGTQTAKLGVVTPDTGAAKIKLSDARQLARTPIGRSAPKSTGRMAVDPPAHVLSGFGQKHIVLDQPGFWIYEGNPIVTDPGGVDLLRSHLTVRGTDRGLQELAFHGVLPADYYGGNAGLIVDTTKIALGKSHLGPSVITHQSAPGVPDPNTPASNDPLVGGSFYIRRATGSLAPSTKYPFEIYRIGKKIKFTANNWKIFQPSTGKYVGLGSIKLQYRRSDGSYSTLKTMSLNSYGTGYYWRTDSTKRRYRLLISTTETAQGSYSQTSGTI
ncbi:hypothetical protein ASC61_08540 [Aeromicrobium sp. Root344]|uniref:hypothetical protein n=1 Tax=Aeromicrobium sp. Root344 TaxID=1736521 RepID=UPI0006F7D319|nr:hypothetical protein [Aeromicrobium sp. Root344]KQV75041.1 hypothetical protein ASC61_08540 [Aeromicrobium sp. Root344]